MSEDNKEVKVVNVSRHEVGEGDTKTSTSEITMEVDSTKQHALSVLTDLQEYTKHLTDNLSREMIPLSEDELCKAAGSMKDFIDKVTLEIPRHFVGGKRIVADRQCVLLMRNPHKDHDPEECSEAGHLFALVPTPFHILLAFAGDTRATTAYIMGEPPQFGVLARAVDTLMDRVVKTKRSPTPSDLLGVAVISEAWTYQIAAGKDSSPEKVSSLVKSLREEFEKLPKEDRQNKEASFSEFMQSKGFERMSSIVAVGQVWDKRFAVTYQIDEKTGAVIPSEVHKGWDHDSTGGTPGDFAKYDNKFFIESHAKVELDLLKEEQAEAQKSGAPSGVTFH